jgi:hypothetical protein
LHLEFLPFIPFKLQTGRATKDMRRNPTVSKEVVETCRKDECGVFMIELFLQSNRKM